MEDWDTNWMTTHYEELCTVDLVFNVYPYEEFITQKYKGQVLTIEVDQIDFEHHPADFRSITDRIDAHLFGLFSG